MSISVERLRRWMLAAVCLLAVVIAGILGYRHYARKILFNQIQTKLHKMGIDVVEETDEYTVSQSAGPGGKTIWTIHASKAIHHKDDMITLENAAIVLYGRTQDREDRISGSKFLYDTKTGTVQAAGEVLIDLQAPAKTATKADAAAKDKSGPDVVHIKTTGLVFKKDLGVAATPDRLEFHVKGFEGSAVGADYNSDTGLLILQSQVQVKGIANGRPVQLAAGRAELDRNGERATLKQAHFTTRREAQQNEEHASAQDMILLLRKDGSPEHIDATGDVTLEPGNGRTMHAAKLAMDVDAAGRATKAHASGGVRFAEDEPLRKGNGSADEATISFDDQGRAQHMHATGKVALTQRSHNTAAEPWTMQTLSANELETALVPIAANSKQVQVGEAWANGSAKLTMESVQAARAGAAAITTNTTISSERMDTKLVGNADGLAHLHGEGKAEILQSGSNGMQTDNKGDTMDVTFRGPAQRGAARDPKDPLGSLNGLTHATLAGHVTIQRADSKSSASGKGMADRADYDAIQDRILLVDHAQWAGSGRIIWANRISMSRTSGDAEALGGVKATLMRDGAPQTADVTHVIAERGLLHQTSQTVEFFGSASAPVRMWQGGSQVEAPILTLEQAQQRLTARGSGATGMQVRAAFTRTNAANSDDSEKKMPPVTRISSHEMTYSDIDRHGVFSGGVQMDAGTSSVTAQTGEVWLSPAAKTKPAPQQATAAQAAQTGMFDGSVERAVASGRVRLTQPGKRGSGDKLVYTAADQKFVLTGTANEQPSLTDARGTTRGASLIFHAGDDSVEILGGPGDEVHTQTRVKPRRQP